MCSSEVKKINTTFENEVFFFFVYVVGVRNLHTPFTKKKLFFCLCARNFVTTFTKIMNACLGKESLFYMSFGIWKVFICYISFWFMKSIVFIHLNIH